MTKQYQNLGAVIDQAVAALSSNYATLSECYNKVAGSQAYAGGLPFSPDLRNGVNHGQRSKYKYRSPARN